MDSGKQIEKDHKIKDTYQGAVVNENTNAEEY